MTRDDVISQAINLCIKELYSYATPHVTWEKFIEENKAFVKREEEYNNLPEENKPSYEEYCGPKPYEFYYLPKEILKDICDDYVHAYNLDSQQNLLDTIEILKNYCKRPIVDKYIPEKTDKDGFTHPGHRGYDHPDSLEKELIELFNPLEDCDGVKMAEKVQNKFFEFLDMAGEFYNWNRDLNTFNMNVYLGASPNSNKEAVIENWKKYRNQDIEIDDEKIKKEYYGDYDE